MRRVHLLPLSSALVVVATLAVVRGQQPPTLSAAWTPKIDTIAAPAAANSTEPQLKSRQGRAILSWLELNGAHSTLKFAERTAYGWSDVRIVVAGDDFMVNSSDVPSVQLLADGTLAAHWLQQDGPDPESYKLHLTGSKDGGRTWSTPATPHRDAVQTQHGFASLFQVPGAGLGLVWLDGRAIKPDAPEGVGNMALRAATFDASGKPRGESVVDARVCECCSTAAAETAGGVIVAYRNRSAGEIRDIYVTRLAAGRWTTPVPVYNDGWKVTGCPVNGPAISARDKDIVVAWFTEKGGQGHAYVAFSHDEGQTFGAPVRIDERSSLGRVGVELLSDGSAVATWVEFDSRASQFRVRRVDPKGAVSPSVRIADSTGTRIPRIAQARGELLFAWTETVDGAPQLRTARAVLPSAGR